MRIDPENTLTTDQSPIHNEDERYTYTYLAIEYTGKLSSTLAEVARRHLQTRNAIIELFHNIKSTRYSLEFVRCIDITRYIPCRCSSLDKYVNTDSKKTAEIRSSEKIELVTFSRWQKFYDKLKSL